MYEHFSFTNGSTQKVFTDVSKALLEAEQLVVNPISVTIGDLEVTPTGMIKLGSDERKITRHGLEAFCKILGIPPTFARSIPEDLLLHNIKRLSNDNSGKPIVLLERPDGSFASIVKSPYKEIPYSDILDRFVSKEPIHIHISEELMKIVLKFEQLKIPDLNDNDHTFYVSNYILSSLIKEISLQSVSGMFKTQCENSFIMPILGKMRANYLKDSEKRLELFAQAFECYDNELVATVFRNFSNSTNRQMLKYQFKYVWDRFSKITSEGEADILFSLDEDSRKLLLTEASYYNSEVKKAKALGRLVPSPEETLFTYYDITNQITTIAHKQLEGIDSVKAEILGGTILQWMIFLN